MTHLYSALCLMARRSFAISIAEAFDNLKLIPFLITAVAGILLTVLLFLRKGAVYRSLGCLSLIATVLLLIAQLFSIPILTYTVVIILLLTAIAFQQELREVFLGIFGGSVLPGKKQVAVVDLHHSVIDAVCQAAVEMSRNHTGALIVLERHIKLDDVARSGVELDAKVSSYLLRNIFYDKAPLHDGAVIIRNCRIWSASCILPLTSRTDIDQDLGTRHRAAIGLSEICDAIVLVVSEETGFISVAHRGELVQDYSFQSLHAFLTRNLLHESEESGQNA
ncbi:MAG: DNA integrity scanning protein DisA nucleotide-binding domain protein [Eubacteriales bacterium]|nr:DNA integrity scanning protein DisA nucleotide-binding domain protein [Eubacteriales bacterium]